MNRIIIAIDGYSSSGKSTMAKELAKKIGYLYVDSGAMYRAVTLYALREGLADPKKGVDIKRLIESLPKISITFKTEEEDTTQHTFLNGEDVEKEIRGMEVSSMVSPISAIAEVRKYLTSMQQNYGIGKGIVMDGRDIGTTVFPNAEMKVFVDASAEERARRRLLELQEKGQPVSFDEVLKNIQDRDLIDTTRKESPLRIASDAVLLNNDNMTKEEQMNWLLDLFNDKTQNL